MTVHICDKCKLDKPKETYWMFLLGEKKYEVCWDCKALIETFINTGNDITAGNGTMSKIID